MVLVLPVPRRSTGPTGIGPGSPDGSAAYPPPLTGTLGFQSPSHSAHEACARHPSTRPSSAVVSSPVPQTGHTLFSFDLFPFGLG